MLCEAILVDREDTCWIKREVVRLMEGNTLWCTIDIHTLHRSVTLHDAFAGSVVSITTRLPLSDSTISWFSSSQYSSLVSFVESFTTRIGVSLITLLFKVQNFFSTNHICRIIF